MEKTEKLSMIALFFAGVLMFMGFWGIDFAFLAATSGKPVYMPLGIFGGEISCWDWWNINWFMILIGESLGILGAYYLGKEQDE